MTEPYSTLILSGQAYWNVAAFDYGLGQVLGIGAAGAFASAADTNLFTPNVWSDNATWYGLEWSIPLTVPERYSPKQYGQRVYAVTPEDISAFVSTAVVKCSAGDSKWEWAVSTADVFRSETRVSQCVYFDTPCVYLKGQRLRAEVWFPERRPVFGAYDSRDETAVAVVFKWLALPRVAVPQATTVLPSTDLSALQDAVRTAQMEIARLRQQLDEAQKAATRDTSGRITGIRAADGRVYAIRDAEDVSLDDPRLARSLREMFKPGAGVQNTEEEDAPIDGARFRNMNGGDK